MEPNNQNLGQSSRPNQDTDSLITRTNAQTYAFEQKNEGRSLKKWFLSLPKTTKILLLGGISFVVITIALIGMTAAPHKLGSTTKLDSATNGLATSTAIDTNGDGTISTDEAFAAADTNGNGVIDKSELFAVADTNGDGVIDSNDTTSLAADTNGDGAVDESELLAAADTNGNGVIDKSELFAVADTNGDGVIDSNDTTSLAADTNGDGAVGNENSSATGGDESSWWQSILGITPGASTGANNTSSSGSESTSSGATSSATVATFNIRTTSLDAWSNTRANAILDFAKSVDIIGLQEGTNTSISWLKTHLDVAGYSDASYKTGEYRAVFWKNSKFTVLQKGSKSLPDGRNLVWVKLRATSGGAEFYFLNVHLKVWGTSPSNWSTGVTSPYRIREINEILSFVKSSIPSSAPVIFVGDMNSHIGSSEDKLIQSGGFKDSFSIATSKLNLGYASASKPILGSAHKSGSGPIDHIYSKGGVKVSRVEVVINQKGSDHVPVEADVAIPGSGAASTTPSPSTPSANTPAFTTINNFRDAGTSGYIKTGLLYRSGNFSDASSADKKSLSTFLKGGTIVNLRPQNDPTISNVTMVQHAIDVNGKTTLQYYEQFVTNSTYRTQLRKSFEDVAKALGSNNKVLIHCTYGKDRTGWMTAILMVAAGATVDQARTEYMVSQTQMTQEKGTAVWVDTTWFNKAVKAAESKYGSVSNYITNGLGVQQSTIDTIKSKLGK